MKFYSNKIVDEARSLREKGMAFCKIGEKFGVNRDTVLRWCDDMKSENKYHLRNLKVRESYKEKGRDGVAKFSITKNNAKLFATLLYWCEGYKYSGCNYVGFVNSDISLMETFVKLLRKGFNLKEDKFRVQLQLHTTHDKKEIMSFWSGLLKIPVKSFQKPTITSPSNKMKRRDYRGTCSVRYYDFSVYNEIVGMYEGFIDKVSKLK